MATTNPIEKRKRNKRAASIASWIIVCIFALLFTCTGLSPALSR